MAGKRNPKGSSVEQAAGLSAKERAEATTMDFFVASLKPGLNAVERGRFLRKRIRERLAEKKRKKASGE